MSRYPMRPLADIISPADRIIEVKSEEVYKSAGVFSFGRGLFARPNISGNATSYRALHRLSRGDLVVARLNAWEGAVAVVPREFDGFHVSPEFPLFEIRHDAVDEGYLSWLCRWPEFWTGFSGNTQGSMVRRKRIAPARVLEITVPLPGIDEQRRIAARLRVVFAAHENARRPIAGLDCVTNLLPTLIDQKVSEYPSANTRLGDLLSVVSDIVHPGDDPSPAESFVGLQHVESHSGRRLGDAPLGGEQGRKFRFRPGDVIYGYLRPYLNKVWVADRWGLCSVDQYVLRPKSVAMAPLLGYLLRSRSVLASAIHLTHSLQLPRLRSGLLLDLEVPVLRGDIASRLVRELDNTSGKVSRLISLQRERQNLFAALAPAILNEAFAGSL